MRPPYQQRVLDEKAELDARVSRLRTYMHGERLHVECGEAERIRLIEQYNAMCRYSDLLGERIAAWRLEAP